MLSAHAASATYVCEPRRLIHVPFEEQMHSLGFWNDVGIAFTMERLCYIKPTKAIN